MLSLTRAFYARNPHEPEREARPLSADCTGYEPHAEPWVARLETRFIRGCTRFDPRASMDGFRHWNVRSAKRTSDPHLPEVWRPSARGDADLQFLRSSARGQR